MEKIYCNYCGKGNKATSEVCKKCGKSLNPKKSQLFKEYLVNHIKENFKSDISDSLFTLIKNYLRSHLYGNVMTIMIVATVTVGYVAYVDNHPQYISNVEYGKESVLDNVTLASINKIQSSNENVEQVSGKNEFKTVKKYLDEYAKTHKNVSNVVNPQEDGYVSLAMEDFDGDGEQEGIIYKCEDKLLAMEIIEKDSNKIKVMDHPDVCVLDDLGISEIDIEENNFIIRKVNNKVEVFIENRIHYYDTWDSISFDKLNYENGNLVLSKNERYQNDSIIIDPYKTDDINTVVANGIRSYGFNINTFQQAVYEQNSNTALLASWILKDGAVSFKTDINSNDYSINYR